MPVILVSESPGSKPHSPAKLQEAEAFANRNFVGLHQSTLRKVDVIADLINRAHDRQLRTNTTWWEMHGGHLRTFWNWIVENKTIAFIVAFLGLALAIWAIAKS